MSLVSLAALLAARTTLCIGHGVLDAHVDGANLHLRTAQEQKTFPLASLRRVILLGRINLPLSLLHDLARANVPAEWQDQHGQTIALLWPHGAAHDCLAPVQAQFSASLAAFELARAVILAKADNCHEILRRRAPPAPEWQDIRSAIAGAENPASLRGHEGAAARAYFGAWHGLLHLFEWKGRHARPAPDAVNLVLNFGYSLLRNRLASSLRHAGLDPRLGFFYSSRGSHCALASDLMEPLRAHVDSATLSLLRLEQLKPENFRMRNGHCAFADNSAYVTLLHAFEAMFAKTHKYYIDLSSREAAYERSLNDLLDDLAESYGLHIHDGQDCLMPRLAPCPAI